MRRLWFWTMVLVGLALATDGPFPATVSPTSPTPLSLSSHPLALKPDGRMLVVANPDSGSVSVVDTASHSVVAEIAVGVTPRSVAVDDHGRAYVANEGSDTLSLVDLAGPAVTATLPVGDRPVAVALSADGHFLAVAEMGADTVRFLATDTLSTLSRRAVPDRPYGLAFTPDGGTLLVSHLLRGGVTALPARPYVRHLPALFRAESAAHAALHKATPGDDSPGAACRPASAGCTLPTWPNVAPAPAVVVNGAGTRAYLPQTMAHGQGLNVQFDNTVFPKVSVLNLETWTHQTAEHISLPETDRPVGLPWDAALAQGGRELWVVNAASNDLSIVDISAPAAPAPAGHIPVGANPRGIVLSPDGATAYVNNTLAGTVSVIDTAAYTVTATITTTTIPLPPLLLEGKRLFYSSAEPDVARAAWIACNSCHIEGEQDGRTWLLQYMGDVPIGATPVITRNTTSLLGMIETYPLRWSAEWDESADSEFSVRFEQFGEGLIDGEMHPTLGAPNQGRSDALDALAAFIDSLALPERGHTLMPAERRGKAIFESPQTQCADCHPPPLYTDLEQHDVGTADAAGEYFGPRIDTPTLRFLYDSAPYLHDGSAPTLLHVLTTANPGDGHGVTSHLTDQQLADLLAFLRSLPFEP